MWQIERNRKTLSFLDFFAIQFQTCSIFYTFVNSTLFRTAEEFQPFMAGYNDN